MAPAMAMEDFFNGRSQSRFNLPVVHGKRDAMNRVTIPATDEELLAECEVETYCSSGPGGQNVNRRSTAVRLRHRPTGLVVACQRERSQWQNKRVALEWLREKLQAMNKRRRPRIATKIPRAVRSRIMIVKKLTGEKKRLRRKPGPGEGT